MDASEIPIIIISRDRLTPLVALVAWLREAGQRRIICLDVDSNYPPLLHWYQGQDLEVVRLHDNEGHLAPWTTNLVSRVAGDGPFVVTDSDVVPDEGCPADAVSHLHGCLQRFPQLVKVGLGLRLDDIPTEYPMRHAVLQWEARFSERLLEPGLFSADVDTTFAVYRRVGTFATGPAARTATPYLARHHPWYHLPGALPDDEAHYAARASRHDTTWTQDEPPEWLSRELEGRPPRRVGRVQAKLQHLRQSRGWR